LKIELRKGFKMFLPIVEYKYVESEHKVYEVNSLVNIDSIVRVIPFAAVSVSSLSGNKLLRDLVKANVFVNNEKVLQLTTGEVVVIADRLMPAMHVEQGAPAQKEESKILRPIM